MKMYIARELIILGTYLSLTRKKNSLSRMRNQYLFVAILKNEINIFSRLSARRNQFCLLISVLVKTPLETSLKK